MLSRMCEGSSVDGLEHRSLQGLIWLEVKTQCRSLGGAPLEMESQPDAPRK